MDGCVDDQDYNDGAQNDNPIGKLNARYRCLFAKPPTTAAAAKEAVEQAAERSFLRRAERSEASRLAAQFGLSFGEEMEDP